MKAATPKNKDRVQSVAITAADISQDLDTKMIGVDVELVEAEKERLMSVGDPDMQPIVTDEELPKREESKLDRSLNSSIVGPAVVGQDQWQRKPYCQICFTKFSVTLRQHHCRMCGRSCCHYCNIQRSIKDIEEAVQQAFDPEMGAQLLEDSMNEGAARFDAMTTRICQYCEVKLDNRQLERFYDVGKTWQRRDADIVDRKLDWYKTTTNEL